MLISIYMFLRDIDVGTFIWLRKDKNDTFGERIRVLKIRNGQVLDSVSLHDGTYNSYHLIFENEKIIKIGNNYTIFKEITFNEARIFVETRNEFLEKNFKKAQSEFLTHCSMKDLFFS